MPLHSAGKRPHGTRGTAGQQAASKKQGRGSYGSQARRSGGVGFAGRPGTRRGHLSGARWQGALRVLGARRHCLHDAPLKARQRRRLDHNRPFKLPACMGHASTPESCSNRQHSQHASGQLPYQPASLPSGAGRAEAVLGVQVAVSGGCSTHLRQSEVSFTTDTITMTTSTAV